MIYISSILVSTIYQDKLGKLQRILFERHLVWPIELDQNVCWLHLSGPYHISLEILWQ